jgi:carbon storage regulator
MLVLSRKDGERIRIGANIFVTVVESRAGKTRIGIEAPTQIPVVRSEIDTEASQPQLTVCPMGRCCPLNQCALNQKAPGKEAG